MGFSSLHMRNTWIFHNQFNRKLINKGYIANNLANSRGKLLKLEVYGISYQKVTSLNASVLNTLNFLIKLRFFFFLPPYLFSRLKRLQNSIKGCKMIFVFIFFVN